MKIQKKLFLSLFFFSLYAQDNLIGLCENKAIGLTSTTPVVLSELSVEEIASKTASLVEVKPIAENKGFDLSINALTSFNDILSEITSTTKNFESAKHAITYEGGSRFGDRMLVYAQARYLSYLTSVSFLYRPFIYSNKLNIEHKAKAYEREVGSFGTICRINSYETLEYFFRIIRDPLATPTLFILEYLPIDISEWDTDLERKILFNIPWHDLAFKNYLRASTQPHINIPDFHKEGMLNVAVHVRTLSGGDAPETSFQFLPLKHPTVDYHQNQIKKVYEWNLARPMQVFIFTDSNEPKKILQLFAEKFKDFNIEFNIQELEAADINYAVQDFFAMQKFNVLIATQSSFSMMAARLGNFDMVILPIHVTGKYPNYKVDRVQVISFGAPWFPYKSDVIFKEYPY